MREKDLLEYCRTELLNNTNKEKKRRKEVIQCILKDKRRNHNFQCITKHVGRVMRGRLSKIYIKNEEE